MFAERTLPASPDVRHPLPTPEAPRPFRGRLGGLQERLDLEPPRPLLVKGLLEPGPLRARLYLEEAEPSQVFGLGLEPLEEAGEAVRREAWGSAPVPVLTGGRQEAGPLEFGRRNPPPAADNDVSKLPAVATILEGLPRQARGLRGFSERVRPGRHEGEATT